MITITRYYYLFTLILLIVYLVMNNIPERCGDKWCDYEDNGLLYSLQKNLKIGQIAYKHHRTIGAINSRIKKIAKDMIKKNENIEDIMDATKLSKETIQQLINENKNPKMMTNGSWNKKKVSNKEQHIQNMKDELFMMKYGYWVKTQDMKEDLDREYELKKYKLQLREPQFEFKYISKSKYPDMILQKIDEPLHFNNDNIIIDKLVGNQNQNIITIYDKLDGNGIVYTHTKYIIDYQPDSNPNSEIQVPKEIEGLYTYLIDKQLETKIKSLESMIFLFENM